VAGFSFEAWTALGLTAAAGILGSLYGMSSILERELEKIRLQRKAREVLAAHQRKMDAIARGEIEAAMAGEELVLPIGETGVRR
jgi:hypothetical protein